MGMFASFGARFRPSSRRTGSAGYWEARYRDGGSSGAGSYGQLAEFKASVLNDMVAARDWHTVFELGCGDGNQLHLATYPRYLGVDVSETAVKLCRERFATREGWNFVALGRGQLGMYDVGLSLDVIYHLVEDAAFERYMATLMEHSAQAVVLYTSDSDVFTPPREEPGHIRHRPVQRWLADHYPEWSLTQTIANAHPWRADDEDNTSFADFYVYERRTQGSAGL